MLLSKIIMVSVYSDNFYPRNNNLHNQPVNLWLQQHRRLCTKSKIIEVTRLERCQTDKKWMVVVAIFYSNIFTWERLPYKCKYSKLVVFRKWYRIWDWGLQNGDIIFYYCFWRNASFMCFQTRVICHRSLYFRIWFSRLLHFVYIFKLAVYAKQKPNLTCLFEYFDDFDSFG